jgi:tRNA(Ile)-lysidine synthase
MIEEFKSQLFRRLQIPASARILVAVSGGMDSVALLHLLRSAEIETSLAHANFQLRGDESDSDELFVKNLADAFGLPFYCMRFDTTHFFEKEGISTQMAARKLRYAWFEEIAAGDCWDYIATAHHMDDQIETFFINLLRGTGISGLKGIPARGGRIIRPLLTFYRSDIEAWVKTHRLDYREDSSNFKTDYLRNRIRHHLIPALDDLQPSFRKIMAGNIDHLTAAEAFFRDGINEMAKTILEKTESETKISVPGLRQSGHGPLLLHEILQPLAFSTTQTQQIWQALDGQAGKTFYSHTHRLVKDRNQLIVQALTGAGNDEGEFVIEKDTSEILTPLHLQFQVRTRDIDFQPVADPNQAFLDHDTIQFPLKLRKWRQGDRFKPLGMKGRMKLSDFFTSNKFSLADKEKAWLLTDADDEIMWIIGHRIAQPYRIKAGTKSVLAITCLH